jgi:LysR family nitrogen assimilation transcriptional regulator
MTYRQSFSVEMGAAWYLRMGGRLLLTKFSSLLRQIDQVKGDLLSLAGTPSGIVALGIVPTASCVLAGRLAQGVACELPKVTLGIVESYGGHLVDWLHCSEMDLAIIYGLNAGVHVIQETLAFDELMIVGPFGSHVGKWSGGSLAWLAGERLSVAE